MNSNMFQVKSRGRGVIDITATPHKVDGHNVVDLNYDLKMTPSGKSRVAEEIRTKLKITSCVYMVLLKEDYDTVSNQKIIDPRYGYIGETGDLMGRMEALRQSYTNPKYSVYHGLGRYMRRNGITLDDVMLRVIPTKTKNQALHLEQEFQAKSKELFGKRFAWEDGASSGRGSAVHKALDLIECIEDSAELDILSDFIKKQRKVINGKKVRSN